MVSDEALVQEVQKAAMGDTRAFEELVTRHQAMVLGNCTYITRSPDDAADLAQEVFVKVYFNIQNFEGRSKFSTWVQRIKINHCLNFLRKKKKENPVDLDTPGLDQHAELQVPPRATADLERSARQLGIRKTLESLPDSMRVPLVLCDLDGLSYQEIADTLGLGLSATKMRIKRAREEFRRRYEEIESR